MVLEYYLSGGKLRIGQKEMMFELLRKDSVLRPLLGYGAGEMGSLTSKQVHTETQEDYAILDFSQTAARKLSEAPERILKELKQRYGGAVGGKLYFRCFYTTSRDIFYFEADLDADEVSMRSSS